MNRLEENIVYKLENAELPYSIKIWDNISKELNIPKKSYLERFWIFGLFLMCGSMAYFISQMPVWNNHTAPTDLIAVNKIVVPTTSKEKAAIGSQSIGMNATNSQKTNEQASTSKLASSNAPNSNTKSQASKPTFTENKKIKRNSKNSDLGRIMDQKDSPQVGQNSKSVINNSILGTNLIEPLANERKIAAENPGKDNSGFTNGFNTSDNKITNSQLPPATPNQQIFIQSGITNWYSNNHSLNQKPIVAKDLIHINSLNTLSNQTLVSNQAELVFHIDEPPFSLVNHIPLPKLSRKNYIRFSPRIFKHQNIFEEHSTDQTAYAELRNSSERERISFGKELVIGRNFSKWLFAEIGIKFEQFHDLFTTKDTPDFITTNPNIPVPLEVEASNKITRWSAPILLGLNIPINNRFSFSPIVGLDVNFKTTYKGQIFNETRQISAFDLYQSSKNPIMKETFHAFVYGFRLNHLTTDRLSFQIGVSRMQTLGSISTNTYSLNHKINSISIDFGSSYSF